MKNNKRKRSREKERLAGQPVKGVCNALVRLASKKQLSVCEWLTTIPQVAAQSTLVVSIVCVEWTIPFTFFVSLYSFITTLIKAGIHSQT